MGRRFTAASSHLLIAPMVSGSNVHARSFCSVSGWFRSTYAGTNRAVIYSEAEPNTASNVSLFIALNDGIGNVGKLRVFARDGSSNLVSIYSSVATLNDGNWHFFTYVRSATNSHTLYVDGASVGTSAININGTRTGASVIRIGNRTTDTNSGFFEGDLSDLATWSPALSLAQHQDLYTRSKHVFNVTGNAADCRSYWSLASGSLIDHCRAGGTALTSTSMPASVDGVDGAAPAAMVPTTCPAAAWLATGPHDTLFPAGAGNEALMREPGNVVHTPRDPGREYKLLYAASANPYTNGNVGTFLAYSSDLVNWTKHPANPVIPYTELPLEDQYCVFHQGLYHLFAENKTGGNNGYGIAYLTSPDAITWTRQDSNGSPLLDAGSGWESQDVSSPVVWVEGGTWFMLYEGRGATNPGEIGLATASHPAGPWTKSPSNPVLARGATGAFDAKALIPDDIVKINGLLYLTYHGQDSSDDYSEGLAVSADGYTWTKHTRPQPLVKKNPSYPQMRLGGTQYGILYNADSGGTEGMMTWKLWGDPAIQSRAWPISIVPVCPQRSAARAVWAGRLLPTYQRERSRR